MYGNRYDARDDTEKRWRTFTDFRSVHATLDWTTRHETPDGSPMVSARVTGKGAAHALHLFTADYVMVLNAPGDQRSHADYSDPTRLATFWRTSGVWVELWVPSTAIAEPVPAEVPPADPALVSTSTGRPLLGPSGQLTFPRRRSKETSRA
ncbi:hypothetical protein ACL07V_37050 [Streptomyces sp. MB22_4]|uniref:hypothetical protein n=1 Tax=Streptomyces sp. MB22_4 TaxID=3383120 RepID=UPI0039A15968